MLNNLNQSIASQIGSAYCSGEDLCKAAVFNRLNTLFNDSQFESFLSTLQSKAYLTGNFINLGYVQPGNLVNIEFRYMDVIKGTTGTARKTVPLVLFQNQTPEKFNALLKMFVPSLYYVSKYPDGTILFVNPDYGYEIAYTGTPVINNEDPGNNGTTGGDTREPSGTIYVPGKEITADPNTQQIINQKMSGFNLSSLVLPGLLLAGFFLLKDKF